jgi:hypothetical protein
VAERGDGFAGEIAQLPRAGTMAHRPEKVAQDLGAFRRVGNFGVKLQTVDWQLPVFHRGQRTGGRGGQRYKIAGAFRHLIPMAHPNLDLGRKAGEQFVRLADLAVRPAIFPPRRALHLAAERLAGEVQTVTNAQHGHSQAKDLAITLRRPRLVHAGRTTGENNSLGSQLTDAFGREIVPDDLAIDVLLPHAPGDQLRILRAEVEHQHFFVAHPLHCLPSGGNRVL